MNDYTESNLRNISKTVHGFSCIFVWGSDIGPPTSLLKEIIQKRKTKQNILTHFLFCYLLQIWMKKEEQKNHWNCKEKKLNTSQNWNKQALSLILSIFLTTVWSDQCLPVVSYHPAPRFWKISLNEFHAKLIGLLTRFGVNERLRKINKENNKKVSKGERRRRKGKQNSRKNASWSAVSDAQASVNEDEKMRGAAAPNRLMTWNLGELWLKLNFESQRIRGA